MKKRWHCAGTLLLAALISISGCLFGGFAMAETGMKVTNLTIQPGADGEVLQVNWMTEGRPKNVYLQLAYAEDAISGKFPEALSVIFAGRAEKSSFEGENGSHYVCRAEADGLEPMTRYLLRVGDGRNWSQTWSYLTPAEKNFSALLVADQHIIENSDWGVPMSLTGQHWDETVTRLKSLVPSASLMLSMGDQVSDSSRKLSFDYLLSSSLNGLAFAPIAGNHDISSKRASSQFFNLPNATGNADTYEHGDYYFAYGKALFVMLNVNYNFTEAEDNEHEDTLRRATESFPDHKWLIVGMHEAVYGCYVPGYAESTLEEEYQRYQKVIDAVDRSGADLVLTGHSHIYGRSAFLKNGEKTGAQAEEGGVYTDPEGTVWINLGAASKLPQFWLDEHMPDYEWLEASRIGRPSYSVLKAEGDRLMVSSYDLLNNSEFDTLTIKKSTISASDGIDETPPVREKTKIPAGNAVVTQTDEPGSGWKTAGIVLSSAAVCGIGLTAYAAIRRRKQK